MLKKSIIGLPPIITNRNNKSFDIYKRFLFAFRTVEGEIFHFRIYSNLIVRFSAAYRTKYPFCYFAIHKNLSIILYDFLRLNTEQKVILYNFYVAYIIMGDNIECCRPFAIRKYVPSLSQVSIALDGRIMYSKSVFLFYDTLPACLFSIY